MPTTHKGIRRAISVLTLALLICATAQRGDAAPPNLAGLWMLTCTAQGFPYDGRTFAQPCAFSQAGASLSSCAIYLPPYYIETVTIAGTVDDTGHFSQGDGLCPNGSTAGYADTETHMTAGTVFWFHHGDCCEACPGTTCSDCASPVEVACQGQRLCPNGTLDPGEECDDGNQVDGDGCDSNCTLTACGNGRVSPGEQCDDSNTVDGDCCSSTCQFENHRASCGNPPYHCNGAGACVECGDGLVNDPDEQCEGGDCCSAACQFEPSGTGCDDDNICTPTDACDGAGACVGSPCADGDVCTQDVCDPVQGCMFVPGPRTDCRGFGTGNLLMSKGSTKRGGVLAWKWLNAPQTTLAEFGTPLAAGSAYTLCVYAAGSRAVATTVHSGANWKQLKESFKYGDKTGSSDGVHQVLLKRTHDGNGKALLTAKGTNLPQRPTGPLALPVRAQLVNTANNVCFESAFSAADVLKNDETTFKAKH